MQDGNLLRGKRKEAEGSRRDEGQGCEQGGGETGCEFSMRGEEDWRDPPGRGDDSQAASEHALEDDGLHREGEALLGAVVHVVHADAEELLPARYGGGNEGACTKKHL